MVGRRLAYIAGQGAVLTLTRETAIVHAVKVRPDYLISVQDVNAMFLCKTSTRLTLRSAFAHSAAAGLARYRQREVPSAGPLPDGPLREGRRAGSSCALRASEESSFVGATDFSVSGGREKAFLRQRDLLPRRPSVS
ncbi:hypothetical protein G7046_g2870 [Stylonectria norvegica]|nr:hypothetical protein G7046_g2870 [Stylonectria norvegica]